MSRLGAFWSGSDGPWANAAWDSKKKGMSERTPQSPKAELNSKHHLPDFYSHHAALPLRTNVHTPEWTCSSAKNRNKRPAGPVVHTG